ncbi:hypothetical protein F5Y16DRAFT_388265 [Xylariaceae sp. FL0255]|nr:hypothetical protein F5Y16DRAFT_388265 [Xylariaceae sp. FL0255]
MLIFSLASGFSSSISTSIGNEILIKGSDYGYVDESKISSQDLLTVVIPWQSGMANSAANYAQQIYTSNEQSMKSTFVQKLLKTMSDKDAKCPFRGKICQSNASNLFLDTGYISLCDDLGVNFLRDQDIMLRKVLHCGPLSTEGRSETTELLGLSNYTSYKYGSSTLSDAGPYTIIVRDRFSQTIRRTNAPDTSGYDLG